MAVKDKGEAGENPLVPNAKLRALYVTMLEARMLEEAAVRLSKGARRRPASIRGQEAVRASSILQLGADDLVSDAYASAGMGMILGASPAELIRGFSSPKVTPLPIDRLLPAVEPAEQRVELALGAASALKTQKRQGVVVIFLRKDELSPAAYRRLLKPSHAYELPAIFIILPRLAAARKTDSQATVSRISGRMGIPGIPVDAADSVALYRVVQESLGRTRGGDGPVLIECIRWDLRGSKIAAPPSDPIQHLEQFMLGRKIATPTWFRSTESKSRRRLKGGQTASKKA
jgi:TPP-dependent pyruvate/acetoin dehydrogenase alpha subunit